MTGWWRRRRDRELAEELESHLAMAVRDRIERGEPAADALANARREFGNEALISEVTREMWGWTWLEHFGRDAKHGLRMLRRNPAFTVTSIVCLALGIGATTVTFSVADALLLRPLPVRDPGSLMAISTRTPDTTSAGLSYRDLLHIRDNAQSFEGVTGFQLARLATGRAAGDVPRMKMGMYVTRDFFSTLGVNPVAGRAFTPQETDTPGSNAVLILSYSFWQSEFGGSNTVLGTSLRINGIPFTIIGVAPEQFTVHPNLSPAYYLPYTMVNRLGSGGADPLESRGMRGLNVRARIREGVSVQTAQDELAAMSRSLALSFPDTHSRHSFTLRTEIAERIQQAPALAVVSGVLVTLALCVLLIACANVASLQFARTQARAREIAIRLSIGAGRTRLLQQLLTESLLLSLAGAAAGVLLAVGAIHRLAGFQLPTDTPIVIAVRLDARVLGIALAAALLTAVLSGLTPAWRSLSPAIAPALTAAGTAPSWRRRFRGRGALVVAQVALSLVLLVVSGGLLDAFRKMMLLDPGIRTDHVMMVEFDPALVRYTPERTKRFYSDLVERMRQLPGVRSASLARAIPFRPNFNDQQVIPEGYVLPEGQRSVVVSANVVDQDYFATMAVPIVRGRRFSAEDTEDSRRVAIVNEEFARRYWPGKDAVGRRFRSGTEGPWIEIVGVTKTGRYLGLTESPQPYLYLPFSQAGGSRMTLLVHTEGRAEDLTAAIMDTVRSIDPDQPVYNVRDMRSYFQQGVLGLALEAMSVVWVMGAAGLLLACIGLYGLVAFSVSRRTREIGVRIALGADRSRVLRLILRQGFTLAAAGSVIGLLGSVPAFIALSTALAGLGGVNVWTLAAAPALLMAVALAATWGPARRASRIDPNRALRIE